MTLFAGQEGAVDQQSGAEKASEVETDLDFFIPKCPGVSLATEPLAEVDPEIGVTADDTSIGSGGVVRFKGKVNIQQGHKSLSAHQAELNKTENTFKAKGDIRYQDQQIRITSQAIDLDISKQTGQVTDTSFQLIRGALRGDAEAINIMSDHQMILTNTGITTCPPNDESWLLQSSEVEIDSSIGEGTARDVVLRINDFPIFYLPTISFPTDNRRKSGFLYPSFGTSSRNGFELEVPWYWNIAPDKDATFEARYLSDRGLMLGGEYRQQTENSSNVLYGEYLPNDKDGLEGMEDRYFYQFQSDYSDGNHWRGLLDINSVSDDDYFYDFGGNYDSGNRNFLKRYGQMSYSDEHLLFTGIISNDELLSTPNDPYSRLPQLRLSLLYPESFIGLTTNLDVEATAFRHETGVEAERLIVVPEISLPMNWLAGYIHPNLKFHYSHYSQDDPADILPESVSRALPIFSVDSGMVFERMLDFSQQSYIQTIEPRLFYLYVPEKEQNEIALFDTTSVNNGVDSLFRENRYTGQDRIGDSNQVSLAITSRIYDQDSGRERMRLTMGRAYFLEDRQVSLAVSENGLPGIDEEDLGEANSALITNLQLNLYDHWWLKGELEYDSSKNETEKGVMGVEYRSSNLALNLRHRLNRYTGGEDYEQSDVSFAWQLTDNFSFVGRWQQDLRKNQTVNSFGGIEYESCCWAVRLVARRYLNIRLDQDGLQVPGTDEFNKGIYLEFILKGLTNIGNGLNLERDIQGYQDRF